MRYIRTKDGRIIKIGEQTDVGYEKGIFEVHNKAGIVASYEPIEVFKEANTIKELCDEFVDTSELKTTNTGGWLYDEFDSDNKCLVYYAEDERRTIPLNEFDLSKIYGAIWTNKGLIYVAKMNEKGCLELL